MFQIEYRIMQGKYVAADGFCDIDSAMEYMNEISEDYDPNELRLEQTVIVWEEIKTTFEPFVPAIPSKYTLV